MEQLVQRELRDAERELASARRALQEQRAAKGRPIGPEDTVRALTTVINHSVPDALADLQRDRERFAEELRQTQERLRTQKDWYSQLRYDVWRLAQAGIYGAEWPVDALEDIVRAVEDSEDDRDWERRHG
jgi:hypothetical protein